MDLIVPQQREYIRTHPIAFWLCAGLLIAGTIGLIAPDLIGQSAASQVLPAWLRTSFYATYAIGAALSLGGLMRGKPALEAAGMAMLGTGFLVQFLSAAYLLRSSIFAGMFLLTLSIGCFQRSRFLA